uniref:Microtubule-associated protein Jupiter n=1 Tax=Anopheles gambiae TaxID=7165 RepID=I7LRE6_ANOGA|nr:TPA_inf: HN1-like protein [Anopheles gambiae]
MTSTNFTVGFGENSKASSKVLKPPGGGSSDLFGADQLGPNTPRTMGKNRMQSNIFAAPSDAHKNGSETPRRNGQGQDSHNRLFGEVNRPFTPAKNHMKSNLPIGNPGDTPTVPSRTRTAKRTEWPTRTVTARRTAITPTATDTPMATDTSRRLPRTMDPATHRQGHHARHGLRNGTQLPATESKITPTSHGSSARDVEQETAIR